MIHPLVGGLLAGALLQAPPAGVPLNAPPAAQADAAPVLEFPEAGLDDTTVYRHYRTRFYRDAHGNAVQVYLRLDEGRVVHLWANDANESVAFTARDTAGRPAALAWGPAGAATARAVSSPAHSITHRLRLPAAPVTLGWFLLGSMRVERDFQYSRRHLEPFDAPPFRLRELSDLIANLERLAPNERQRHLALLDAEGSAELRHRLDATITLDSTSTTWTVRVARPSLDANNHLTLELEVARSTATVTLGERTVTVHPRSTAPVILTVRATSDARPLTPLSREDLFNAEFRAFAERVRSGPDSLRARRLERQIRGLELVSYEEKLMAGLPNFATYFGRDMMVTSLLMEPIWAEAMLEHVIASVLRKLAPTGDVSHEEALGGQAIREAAAEYNALLGEYLHAQPSRRADTLLARARALLREPQQVRENYIMVDDDFQLPVLAARYLANPRIAAERKRAFLLDTLESKLDTHESKAPAPALTLLLRNLTLVAERAAPYAAEPMPTRLVGFPRRDEGGWHSASWRDSRAGYANGRFAMDVNVIWVPQALIAIEQILASLKDLGLGAAELERAAPEVAGTRLAAYLRDPALLATAAEAWRGTARHFLVQLDPATARRRIEAKLAWLPEGERGYWSSVWPGAPADTVAFLALSLDGEGRPIPIMHSDAAMRLLLEQPDGAARDSVARDAVRRDLRPFLLPYPTGLHVEGLGPIVANDAYAPPAIWETFDEDRYHSPRVVWGREVNVLVMALAQRILAVGDGSMAPDDPAAAGHVDMLRDALRTTRAAVEAAGLGQAELWSYRIDDGRLRPERYGTSSDVQLWNLTDLAVQFVLDALAVR